MAGAMESVMAGETAAKKTLTVEQTGSPIGRRHDQEATLKGLGLNRLHRRRVLEDTPARARHDPQGRASGADRRGKLERTLGRRSARQAPARCEPRRPQLRRHIATEDETK